MPDIQHMRLNLGSASRQISGAYPARPRRHRTCLNGKLVYGDGAYTLDCAVRDLSEGGAKVVIPKRQAVPLDLFLIVVRYCIAHECRVVWLNFPARGLKFTHSYELSKDLPPELKFLRRLWGNMYAQVGWDTMLKNQPVDEF
jgi:hypothetical protein